MNQVWSIVKKEWRAYFHSPIAIIFLATFLLFTMFSFFWSGKFFARNVADVRLMFEGMPLLLIFLVAALAMRLWSEEQKTGTLEILLTLPVAKHKLVIGKFLAGMALIALSLTLTLGLPLTVSMMGNLDWGPVWGSYLGTLLLAGAYLAIGMCVSAVTSDQIASLILTAIACFLFYLPGVEAVQSFMGPDLAPVVATFGTSSRFLSIARGVLDLRDLAYYAGLIAFFLALNTLLLHAKSWSAGEKSRRPRLVSFATTGLILANVLLLNLWMSPLARARIDMTEHKQFSLSSVTTKLLHSLNEPLTIRAYTSEKNHPKLTALIPTMRDLLAEYKVEGGRNVRVEFVDPSKSDTLAAEANEQYGIKSRPIPFSDRNQESVVNAYFSLLIAYGDQHEVIDLPDLITVSPRPNGEPDVGLKNLEYGVTQAIKKVAYGFQSLDSMFAQISKPVEMTAYITPSTLPPQFADLPGKVKAAADEIAKQSGGKFTFAMSEPKTEAERQSLLEKYGFQAFVISPFSRDFFYSHFVVRVNDKEFAFLPPQDPTEVTLKESISDAIKRGMPGFIKKVGLVTPKAEANPMGGGGGQEQPAQSFEQLRNTLSGNYQVDPTDLESGRVDDSVDVLVLAGPKDLSEKAQQAVDQFVMRGGALIALAGRYRLDMKGRELSIESVRTGLEDLLASWGVTISDQVILDPKANQIQMPIERQIGNQRVQEVQKVPYLLIPQIDEDGITSGNPITSGLATIMAPFSSAVQVNPTAGQTAQTLFSSSKESWTSSDTKAQPDFDKYKKYGFAEPSADKSQTSDANAAGDKAALGEKSSRVIAVTLTGQFPSFAAKKEAAKNPAPLADKTAAGNASFGKPADGKEGESDAGEEPPRLLEKSPPDARIVVIGSSSIGADGLANKESLTLIHNMVDWAVADADLLTIRNRGAESRMLKVTDEERGRWEITNYVIAAVALGLIVAWSIFRRRTTVPIALSPGAGTSKGNG